RVGFGQVRHTENVRAPRHEERGDLFQRVAVGVRLDDRQNLYGGPDAMSDPRKVPAERVQIDLRPAPIARLHRVISPAQKENSNGKDSALDGRTHTNRGHTSYRGPVACASAQVSNGQSSRWRRLDKIRLAQAHGLQNFSSRTPV